VYHIGVNIDTSLYAFVQFYIVGTCQTHCPPAQVVLVPHPRAARLLELLTPALSAVLAPPRLALNSVELGSEDTAAIGGERAAVGWLGDWLVVHSTVVWGVHWGY
jgi:hypothetical protein